MLMDRNTASLLNDMLAGYGCIRRFGIFKRTGAVRRTKHIWFREKAEEV